MSNFSAVPQAVSFHENLYPGKYLDFFRGETVELGAGARQELAPWEYRVYVR